MRRAAAVIAAALFVCSSASAAHKVLRSTFFELPSKNIGCVFNAGQPGFRPVLRCDILSGLRPRPQGRCELDWTGLLLARTGRAHLSCAGDTAVDRHSPTLRYGSTWRRGGITCTSRATGLTCRNQSGRGFFLSRQRWRAF